MKNLIIKSATTIMMLGTMSVSLANTVTVYGKVKDFKVTNQNVMFNVSTGVEPVYFCTPVEGKFYEVDNKSPLFDEIFSMVITAKTTDMDISVEVKNQAFQNCQVNSISF